MTAILPGSPSERVTPDRAPTGLPASWHEAPADTPPLNSFWMGGIEGADHLNSHGVPLDMTRACGHRAHLDEDFRQLAHWGLRTVRESVGWRLCERDGQVDLTPALQIAEAAQRHGVQVLWTLMHYGTPPDISLLDDRFPERFAQFAGQAAAALAPFSDTPPVYTPINEISFLSWALAETRMLHPYGPAAATGDSLAGSTLADGFSIKRRLVKAVLLAIDAIRAADPRARFLHVEPVVHVVPPADQPELQQLADQVASYQWQAWDMIAGRLAPELGGNPAALDLIGINHYHNGQWEVVTERRLHWHLRDPRRRPLSRLLYGVWRRYRRPILISETSHIGVGRAEWLDEVATEVQLALAEGVPVHGLCLYPIFDRPDWEREDHWHHSGLWDHCVTGSASEPWPRRLDLAYASALARWQVRLRGPH